VKAPPKRKRHALSDVAPSRSLPRRKTTPEIPNAQAKVEGFQHALAVLDESPLPRGSTATDLLDTCKFAQAFCEKVFKKARELLLKEPDAVPGWHVSEIPQRYSRVIRPGFLTLFPARTTSSPSNNSLGKLALPTSPRCASSSSSATLGGAPTISNMNSTGF
jgi:hypothetical protein